MAFTVKMITQSGNFEHQKFEVDSSYKVTDGGVLYIYSPGDVTLTLGVGRWHSVEDDGEMPEMKPMIAY